MATLSDALRRAALDRAEVAGNVVDAFVLEPDGVIDLRQIEAEQPPVAPRTAPMLPTLGLTEDDLDLRDVRPPTDAPKRRSIVRRSESDAPS